MLPVCVSANSQIWSGRRGEKTGEEREGSCLNGRKWQEMDHMKKREGRRNKEKD